MSRAPYPQRAGLMAGVSQLALMAAMPAADPAAMANAFWRAARALGFTPRRTT